MKLYSWSLGVSPRRVRIFLAEKGIEVPMEDVGVPDQPGLKPEFLAAHPERAVPILELDDGACISEAMAICAYFEALHPDPPLMGVDPKSKAVVAMWERRADLDGLRGGMEFIRNAHPMFADRAFAGWSTPVAQIPALVARGQARVRRFFDIFDGQLADHEFVAGDRYSVADITALCAVDLAKRGELEAPDSCANLARWYAAVSARPSATA